MLGFISQRVEWSHCIISLLQVQISNVGIGVIFIAASEGSLARHQFVSKNTNCPQVNLVVIGLLVDQLRGNVVNGTTESCPSLVYGVGRPAEVAEFDCHLVEVGDQNVLRLDVPMNHIAVLQVQQGFYYLHDYVLGFLLCEALLPSELLIQVTMFTVV